MHRRLYTPRQRRSYRRRQLLRDLVLGAVVVAIAQIAAPHLPFLQRLEALPVVATAPATRPQAAPTLLGGTSATAAAQVAPRHAAPYAADRTPRDR